MAQGPKTILDETQEERDLLLAEYLGVPVEKVAAIPIGDRRGPPIHTGSDLNADSYDHLYENWAFPTVVGLKAFSLFIVQKRASLVRRLEARVGAAAPQRIALDYGCGVGSHGIYLLQRGWRRVDFVDVDGPAILYAEWRARKLGFSDRARFFTRAERLPMRMRYDDVLCVDVLEHVADPLWHLRRIAKVHSGGGWLVLQLGKKVSPRQGHFERSNRIIEGRQFHKVMKRNWSATGERFFYRRRTP